MTVQRKSEMRIDYRASGLFSVQFEHGFGDLRIVTEESGAGNLGDCPVMGKTPSEGRVTRVPDVV